MAMGVEMREILGRLRYGSIAVLSMASAAGVFAYGQSKSTLPQHWVSTWATAQELAPTVPDQPILAPGVKRPNFNGNRRRNPPNIPTDVTDQTIRMIVHTSIGGKWLRIELSNAFQKGAVTIGGAHIAVRSNGSSIEPGTDREITFAGTKTITLQPGVLIVSDPVNLDFKPLSDLAVSLYVKQSAGIPTAHTLGLHTSYISKGDVTAQNSVPPGSTTTSYLWLRSVDVDAPKDDFAVVCLGDSITDGQATTLDANQAWPTLLAERLHGEGNSRVAVLNEGISGNQVLRDGAGVSALARFDRDVASIPGVKWVIVLEGINDINIHGQVTDVDALTPQDLIVGYRQIIQRAHMLGLKVMGATLTSDEGIWLYGPVGEQTRTAVNTWIRTGGEFDAIVDFDTATRDRSHVARLHAAFNSGDNIHPNDAGNRAMAGAIPTKLLR
jgi:lysophospholipase L1-like esterase